MAMKPQNEFEKRKKYVHAQQIKHELHALYEYANACYCIRLCTCCYFSI